MKTKVTNLLELERIQVDLKEQNMANPRGQSRQMQTGTNFTPGGQIVYFCMGRNSCSSL